MRSLLPAARFARAQLVTLPLAELRDAPWSERPGRLWRQWKRAPGLLAFLAEGLGPRPAVAPDAGLTVLLLSFRRPLNMEPLVRLYLACPFVRRVVVCNNNPELRVADLVAIRDDRVTLLDRDTPTLCGYRYELARRFPSDAYLAVDDDIFLRVGQVRRLYDAFRKAADRPHGVRGSVFEGTVEDLQRPRRPGWPFRRADPEIERQADILNGVYMFGSGHLERYFDLCAGLGIHDQTVFGNADDMILSHSGAGRPVLATGREPILMCASADLPGVALSTTDPDAFLGERWRIFRGLRLPAEAEPGGAAPA